MISRRRGKKVKSKKEMSFSTIYRENREGGKGEKKKGVLPSVNQFRL